MRLLSIPAALVALLLIASVAVADAQDPAALTTRATSPVRVGEAQVTVYPLGTAIVEMPVMNPTRQTQTFRLVLVLLRADGSVSTIRETTFQSLAAGQSAWLRFTVRHGDETESAIVEAITD